jgi:hypothetical protein
MHPSQYETQIEPLVYGFERKLDGETINGWGCLMFNHKLNNVIIPNDLKHWCGDTYCLNYSKFPNYSYLGEKIYTEMSTSLSPEILKIGEQDQRTYVEKYLKVYKNKIKSYIDTYFAIFFPLAIGKPDDWVLQGTGISASLIARQNPAFDVNKDGKVQVWEVKKIMLQKLPREWVNDGTIGLAIKSYKDYLTIGLILIAIGATYIYNVRKR